MWHGPAWTVDDGVGDHWVNVQLDLEWTNNQGMGEQSCLLPRL